MTARSKLRRVWVGHLWRWHRRLGLLASCLVLLIALTGFLLNHADEWGWDKQYLHSSWLLKSYGVEVPTEFVGQKLFDRWWVLANEQLFLQNEEVARCGDAWKGVVATQHMVIAACEHKIALFTAEGELIEVMNSMPSSGLRGIGLLSETLLLIQYEGKAFQFDLMSFSVAPVDSKPTTLQTLPPAPKALAKIISSQYSVPGLTWERFVQDLHAGRWFGGWGWVLVDLTALFLVMLSLTGVLLYSLHRRKA